MSLLLFVASGDNAGVSDVSIDIGRDEEVV